MINIIQIVQNRVTVNTGTCYQISAVVDGLLCGLVGKIVARLEENCKRLWCDEFDRAGIGF